MKTPDNTILNATPEGTGRGKGSALYDHLNTWATGRPRDEALPVEEPSSELQKRLRLCLPAPTIAGSLRDSDDSESEESSENAAACGLDSDSDNELGVFR